MSKSYSIDLRERVAGFIDKGQSRRAAARHFGVSESFAIKLDQRRVRSGSIAPQKQGRPRGSGKLEVFEAFLIGAVEAKPDITMPELATLLMEAHSVTATSAVLSRFLCRRGFTYWRSEPSRPGVRSLRRSVRTDWHRCGPRDLLPSTSAYSQRLKLYRGQAQPGQRIAHTLRSEP